MGATAAVHPADPILQAYGLGKLDDISSGSVSQHLEGCDSCRRRVAALSSDEFLGRLQRAKVTPDEEASGWSPSAGSSTEGTSGPIISAPPADTLPPELVDHPNYEIVRELGRGGMGVVYLAKNKLMGRLEVLKVVGRHLIERPGVADRFLREIRSAAKLHHANIVTAHSALQLGESLMLAMEYVEGLDLARMVKSKGPLPTANACYFIHQAALGLQHAYERGMVHRDIKPANLILARDGKKAIVKVLDFGLAKVSSEGQTDGKLTREGQMLGTPDFIAPEQIRDAQSADIRADIYSLGCTFYYLLTGGPPFRGDHLWDVYQAHFSTDASPLNLVRPEVPVELAAVVARMMAKEPGRRFQTPGDVARALSPFFKRDGVTGSTAALSEVQVQRAGLERSRASNAPIEAAAAAGPGRPDSKKPVAAAHQQPQWESLIELNDPEQSVAAAPALAAARPPSWVWPSAAIGLLMLALFGAWLGGVLKVTTPEGVIVLENLPNDAQVFVDGGIVTLQTINGSEFTISVAAGKKLHLQVKKDGYKTFGEVVEIDAGGRRSITVRLEPLPVAAAAVVVKPADASVPIEKSAAAVPIAKKADYDAIATGKWIPVLETEMVLRDQRVLIPEQEASNVIIRARVKKVTGQNLALALRRDQEPRPMRGYGAWFSGGNRFGIVKWGGTKELGEWRAPTNFDDFFEFAFSAVGEMLTIYADGKRIGQARDPGYRLGSLSVAALHGRSLFQDVEIMILDKPSPPTSDTGFVPLFNGKDLTGWDNLLSNGSEWKVIDGVLAGHGAGDAGPAVLVSRRTDFANFRLRVKYRYQNDGAGNIEIRRSAIDENRSAYLVHHGVWPTFDQWQAPVCSFTKVSNLAYSSGFLWDSKPEPIAVPLNEWNTLEIEAVKNRFISFVNGKQVFDARDASGWYGAGGIALHVRSDSVVQFQKIMIKELPD